jgi:hypothetical protein
MGGAKAIITAGDVRRNVDQPVTRRRQFLRQAGAAITIGEAELCALRRETARDGPADAARGPGDDRHAPVHAHPP